MQVRICAHSQPPYVAATVTYHSGKQEQDRISKCQGPWKYLRPKSALFPSSQEFFLYIPKSDSDCCSCPETLLGSLQKDPIVIFLLTDYTVFAYEGKI